MSRFLFSNEKKRRHKSEDLRQSSIFFCRRILYFFMKLARLVALSRLCKSCSPCWLGYLKQFRGVVSRRGKNRSFSASKNASEISENHVFCRIWKSNFSKFFFRGRWQYVFCTRVLPGDLEFPMHFDFNRASREFLTSKISMKFRKNQQKT